MAREGTDAGVDQGMVLVAVVPRSEWDADRTAVLSAVHTKLEDQTRRRGLVLTADTVEDVEILPHDTRVRITVRAGVAPRQRLE